LDELQGEFPAKYETGLNRKVIKRILAGADGAWRWSVTEEKVPMWVNHYRLHGIDGLQSKRCIYSTQFKLATTALVKFVWIPTAMNSATVTAPELQASKWVFWPAFLSRLTAISIVYKTLVALSFACLLPGCDSVLQDDPVVAMWTAAGAQAKPVPSKAATIPQHDSSPERLSTPSAIKTAHRFEDYATAQSFRGSTSRLTFSTNTERYRGQFAAAAGQSPNFAGHFILTHWGCGTNCQMGGVIDARTGQTTLIPFTVCCSVDSGQDVQMMDFRPNSRLIIFNGLLDEKEKGGRRHVYTFENGDFILSPSDAGGTWRCHNDLEIDCRNGRCNAAKDGSFSPMNVTLSESGSMSVCAYSGCWTGNALFKRSGHFRVWVGSNLAFSTAPKSPSASKNILIAIDEKDSVATLKAGEFALPLLCQRAESR
jgi:hypothetical protein